jgi:hypothetical protein
MNNRERSHLYYGGESLKYYLTPAAAVFITRRAALTGISIETQPEHKGKEWVEGGEHSR